MRRMFKFHTVALLVTVHLCSLCTSPAAADSEVVERRNPAANQGVGPIFVGQDLTSNQSNGMANETLQVITAYDGVTGSVTLSLEVREIATGTLRTIDINVVNDFGVRLDTFEYDLNGHELTFGFEVSGVVPNGVIDGLAFGIYWKDSQGDYHMAKSNVPGSGGAHYFGAWPLGMNDASFQALTPQITNGNARQQARAALYGAALLPNGQFICSDQNGSECSVVPVELISFSVVQGRQTQ